MTAKAPPYVITIDDVTPHDGNLVGGKAKNLGIMVSAGLSVPPGFVVTTTAYQAGMTTELRDQIYKTFDTLASPYVAVRSSAIAEDGTETSWAGQMESYLFITRTKLIDAIESCWQSLSTDRVNAYAQSHNTTNATMAVIVQRMVHSDISGVIFTADPVTNDRQTLTIEAIVGVGELLVQGEVTPETIRAHYDGKVLTHTPSRQHVKLTLNKTRVTKEKTKVPARIVTQTILNELIVTAKRIEEIFGRPQDIEWAIENNRLYIVQSRPITTLRVEARPAATIPEFIYHCKPVISRPSTLQRDEIFRLVCNVIAPVRVMTLSERGNARTYYADQADLTNMLQANLKTVDTQQKRQLHERDYLAFREDTSQFIQQITQWSYDPTKTFSHYFAWLKRLSIYLNVAVALDKVLEPDWQRKLKVYCADPKTVAEINTLVGKPTKFHDYQQFRLELCDTARKQLSLREKEQVCTHLSKSYAHLNEYSFIEPLLSPVDVRHELDLLDQASAQTEQVNIHASIEKDLEWQKQLEILLPDPKLREQAQLIKLYAWLRTDRIDQLKRVQVVMRRVYDEVAKMLTMASGQQWSLQNVVWLTNNEIDDFMLVKAVPDLAQIKQRAEQPIMYIFHEATVRLSTDTHMIAAAQAAVNANKLTTASTGMAAYPGTAQGKVVIIHSQNDLESVIAGSILVARLTMPIYTPAMQRAAGIITAEGGITSHASIIARELKKPCLVGVSDILDRLKDGDEIILDTSNRVITKVTEAD